jgi:hypothetical protein
LVVPRRKSSLVDAFMGGGHGQALPPWLVMGAYRERQRRGRAGQGRHGGGCMVTTFLFAPAVLRCFLGKKRKRKEKEGRRKGERKGREKILDMNFFGRKIKDNLWDWSKFYFL